MKRHREGPIARARWAAIQSKLIHDARQRDLRDLPGWNEKARQTEANGVPKMTASACPVEGKAERRR